MFLVYRASFAIMMLYLCFYFYEKKKKYFRPALFSILYMRAH